MLDMLIPNIFDSKVIDNADTYDWSQFMSPQARGGGCLIVPRFFEAGAKEIICQFSTLWETVATSDDFKVDPPIARVVGEIVLVE